MDDNPTLRLLPWLTAAVIWAGIFLGGAAHFDPGEQSLVVTVARAH